MMPIYPFLDFTNKPHYNYSMESNYSSASSLIQIEWIGYENESFYAFIKARYLLSNPVGRACEHWINYLIRETFPSMIIANALESNVINEVPLITPVPERSFLSRFFLHDFNQQKPIKNRNSIKWICSCKNKRSVTFVFILFYT